MLRPRTAPIALAACTVVLAALAGCGGGSSSSSGSSNSSAASSGSSTVAVKKVDSVGSVLVDGKGAALYTPAEEASGMIRCTGKCTSFWVPLAPGSGAPTSATKLSGKLAVVNRPDGSKQVTYKGGPLYRFSPDGGAGKLTGNGVKDSFGGQKFTWHAVTAAGAQSKPPKSHPTGGYSY